MNANLLHDPYLLHGGEREVLLWHYTVGRYFESILADGYIKPTTAYITPGERPAVWFSLNQDWEQTANKLWLNNDGTVRALTRDETRSMGGGLVRFGVSPRTAPFNWRQFVTKSRIDRRVARAVVDVAHKQGSDPAQWRVSFDPVPRKLWLAVDVWDSADHCWVRVADEAKLHRSEQSAA